MNLEAFGPIARRFGQRVTLHTQEGDVEAKAFVQPLRESGEGQWQEAPTPIGPRSRERYRYLGEPGVSLEEVGVGGKVTWMGMELEVQACQPMYVGNVLTHWWGILRRIRGEVETA